MNEPSKTSTRRLWKSAAYSRSPEIARPKYEAPKLDRSFPSCAARLPAQPRIVPLWVAKMKRAGAITAPFGTRNCEPPLKTTPVGLPGTETTSGVAGGNGWPAPL